MSLGASAPFAAPVPPSVIAVSPVGEDDTFTGVSESPVVELDGPHAYNKLPPTINAKNTFFITSFLLNNRYNQKIIPHSASFNALIMFIFKKTDSSDPEFVALVTLLDADLAIRDGADHSFYSQFNKIDMIKNAIVCYENDVAIGCGAFKPFDKSSVEIKRMFVTPVNRGKGVGHLILEELEQWAAASGYQSCVLETGKKQPEAIRLYQKAGYDVIENYGQYAGVENSVCMKKDIAN